MFDELNLPDEIIQVLMRQQQEEQEKKMKEAALRQAAQAEQWRGMSRPMPELNPLIGQRIGQMDKIQGASAEPSTNTEYWMNRAKQQDAQRKEFVDMMFKEATKSRQQVAKEVKENWFGNTVDEAGNVIKPRRGVAGKIGQGLKSALWYGFGGPASADRDAEDILKDSRTRFNQATQGEGTQLLNAIANSERERRNTADIEGKNADRELAIQKTALGSLGQWLGPQAQEAYSRMDLNDSRKQFVDVQIQQAFKKLKESPFQSLIGKVNSPEGLGMLATMFPQEMDRFYQVYPQFKMLDAYFKALGKPAGQTTSTTNIPERTQLLKTPGGGTAEFIHPAQSRTTTRGGSPAPILNMDLSKLPILKGLQGQGQSQGAQGEGILNLPPLSKSPTSQVSPTASGGMQSGVNPNSMINQLAPPSLTPRQTSPATTGRLQGGVTVGAKPDDGLAPQDKIRFTQRQGAGYDYMIAGAPGKLRTIVPDPEKPEDQQYFASRDLAHATSRAATNGALGQLAGAAKNPATTFKTLRGVLSALGSSTGNKPVSGVDDAKLKEIFNYNKLSPEAQDYLRSFLNNVVKMQFGFSREQSGLTVTDSEASKIESLFPSLATPPQAIILLAANLSLRAQAAFHAKNNGYSKTQISDMNGLINSAIDRRNQEIKEKIMRTPISEFSNPKAKPLWSDKEMDFEQLLGEEWEKRGKPPVSFDIRSTKKVTPEDKKKKEEMKNLRERAFRGLGMM